MAKLNIVLYEPEIPSNTGNIGRTCVATGTRLHLIEPLGFRLNEKSINRTIKNTVATFEGICRKKMITIELHLESETLMVHADMEQIQQVLYNLIDNAIKFSSDNSIIKAETSERHGTVFVSIKDSGVGIPREKQNKIWDRFYKIDSSRGKDRKGTGLGLSIVREIIAAHNQNINVISTEGVGTEFIFTLEKSKGTS